MKRKYFLWRYADGIVTIFPSYHKAAKALGVSVPTIAYYEAYNIHSEKDKRWKRK